MSWIFQRNSDATLGLFWKTANTPTIFAKELFLVEMSPQRSLYRHCLCILEQFPHDQLELNEEVGEGWEVELNHPSKHKEAQLLSFLLIWAKLIAAVLGFMFGEWSRRGFRGACQPTETKRFSMRSALLLLFNCHSWAISKPPNPDTQFVERLLKHKAINTSNWSTGKFWSSGKPIKLCHYFSWAVFAGWDATELGGQW